MVSTIQHPRSTGFSAGGVLARLAGAVRGHGVKAFWVLMVGAHMPALVGCFQKLVAGGSTWSGVGSFVLLLGSMTFFLLKIADARFARFHLTRRSSVGFVVLVAFLHFDAVRSGDNPTLIPEYTSLVAAATIASRAALVRRRDLVAGGGHEHPTGAFSLHLVRANQTVWMDSIHPHCWTRWMRVFALRAPPVWNSLLS